MERNAYPLPRISDLGNIVVAQHKGLTFNFRSRHSSASEITHYTAFEACGKSWGFGVNKRHDRFLATNRPNVLVAEKRVSGYFPRS